MDLHDITRLQSIDTALSSPDGLHYATAATQHGCTTKTIQRLVSLLRSTGREIVLRESPDNGKLSRHHYAPGTGTLFAREHDREMMTIPRGGRPPTIDEVKRADVIDRLRQGWTYAEIAMTTGISQPTVMRIAKANGITRPRGRRKAQRRIK